MTKGLRNSNGLGHTYKVGSSYKTVISRHGKVFTATARTISESRQKAIEKADWTLNQSIKNDPITLEKYLMDWLENEHQFHIAHTTYKRYRSLAIHHINPTIGNVQLSEVTARDVTGLLTKMRNGGQGTRSQQQARARATPHNSLGI
jgi:Phage integrase, N-terminal SAM-like domain